jgi:uncharacterized protein (DUF1778 family)
VSTDLVDLKQELIMGTTAQKMDDRIQLRASLEEKTLLKLASEAAGFRNLTNFIMKTMISESRRILAQQGTRTLSDKDSEIIVSSLINPPKPNEKLKKLFNIK